MVPRLPQRPRAARRRNKSARGVAPPLPSRQGQSYANALRNLNLARARGPPRPSRLARQMGMRRQRRRGPGAVLGAGNSVLTGKMFGMGAQNRSTAQRRFKRVENDEFIAAVLSAGTGANFGTTAFACNPGNATTFPWLSGEATQWEKYYFEYLEFYYEHDVSAFATAGTTGKVVMSFDYDAADAPPTTKQQMLDTLPHADGMPNEDFGITMNPQDLSGRTDLHYVRLAGLPGGADIRLYDVGNLNIATQGIASNATELGELHVRYAVVFEVPVLSSDVKAAPANNQVSWFQSTAAQTYLTGVGAIAVNATASSNGLGIFNTTGTFEPPAGNYLVDFSASGKDTSAEAIDLIVTSSKMGSRSMPCQTRSRNKSREFRSGRERY